MFFGLTTGNIFLLVIFLPVPLYFIFAIVKRIRNKNANENKSKTSFVSFLLVFIFFLLMLFVGFYNVFIAKKQTASVAKSQKSVIIIPTKKAAPLPAEIIVKTDSGKSLVNVRKDATSSAEIMVKVRDNQTFKVISEKSGWLEIALDNGTTGWISKELAQIKE